MNENKDNLTPETPENLETTPEVTLPEPVEPVAELPGTPTIPPAPVEAPAPVAPVQPVAPTPSNEVSFAPQDASPPAPFSTPSPDTTPPAVPTLGGPTPSPDTQGAWPATSSQPLAEGQSPSYAGVAPAPKRSSLPLIVGIAAIAVIAVVAFLLTRGGKSKLAANPEDTLFMALSNTEENIDNFPALFPESDFDFTKPYETTLDLNLDASGNEYLPIPDYINTMRLKMNLLHDLKNRELLFGAQFESPIFTLNHSEIYFSPKEVLFSVPDIYDVKDYVHIDFSTFTQDWNESEYGVDAPIPEDVDIADTITQFMDMTDELATNVEEMDELETIDQLMAPANDKLKAAATITHEGTTDTTFDFKVIIPPEDMNLYLNTLADEMDELTFSQRRQIADAIPASFYGLVGSSPDEFLSEFMSATSNNEFLRTFVFNDDVVLLVSVDKEANRISHVTIENTSVMSIEYADEVIYLNGTIDLATSDNVLDDFNFTLYMSDELDGLNTGADIITIELIHRTPGEDLVGNYVEMNITMDDRTGELEGYKVIMDLSWNKEKAETEPMVLKMSMKDIYYEEEYGAVISALVQSDKDSIHLSDGRITLKEGVQDILTLSFDFASKPATTPLKPSPSSTVDFFDVDWMTQLGSYAMSVYNRAMTMM